MIEQGGVFGRGMVLEVWMGIQADIKLLSNNEQERWDQNRDSAVGLI